MAGSDASEGQAVWQPVGAEEDNRLREGNRHLHLAYVEEEEEVGPVSVYGDWVTESLISIFLFQCGSTYNCPSESAPEIQYPPCCWDVKEPYSGLEH